MLIAMMLSSVRTGRCFRFSKTSLLINLLVGYDYALRRRRNLAQLAREESSVAEHPVQLAECIGVAVGGGPEHHHAEHGGRWRGDAVVVRDEFERDGAATGRERCMHFLEQRLVGRRVEVMQEIRQQHQIVAGSEVRLESAAWLDRIAR